MYPYSHGGREFRYQALLPRLAERVEMHVYTMRWWDGPKVYTENGVTFHAIAPRLSMYTRNGRRSILQGALFAIFSLCLLFRHFDVLDADQIPYFHLFPLHLIASIRRKPFIATWHEVWGPSAWHDYLKWLGWLGWLIEYLSFRMPDHIIAASAQTSARLHEYLGDRASVITVPNGIDVAAISQVPVSPVKVDVVTVGRLIEHKRIHVLLQTIAALHARGINATCRIIGDGPDRLSLQQQAQTLGIESAVEFLYDVTEQKELYSLVKSARLFVSLSTREGFGIAVLEAIACGVPVLTTDAPDNLGQYLAMRYSHGIVCGTSVTEITDAMAGILVAPESSFSLATDSWVAEYSWDTMIERIANLYRSRTQSPLPAVTPQNRMGRRFGKAPLRVLLAERDAQIGELLAQIAELQSQLAELAPNDGLAHADESASS